MTKTEAPAPAVTTWTLRNQDATTLTVDLMDNEVTVTERDAERTTVRTVHQFFSSSEPATVTYRPTASNGTRFRDHYVEANPCYEAKLFAAGLIGTFVVLSGGYELDVQTDV